jgi:catechol 2,3-dioxygenase-like lactoylglutathione lyase family enzyme
VHLLHVKLDAAEARVSALGRFYADELGLPDVRDGGTNPVVKVGTTVIEFKPVGHGRPFYHFALRVPRNRFGAAREWLAGRTELLRDEQSGETTFRFDNWNADACYAHDPCGNIVELIAHHELPEESPEGAAFSAGELLGVCELGLVSADVGKMARALVTLGIPLWDGSVDEPGRLAFMGGREGVLILSPEGRGWMPTGRAAERHRVEALISGEGDAEAILPGTPHRITISSASSVGPPDYRSGH